MNPNWERRIWILVSSLLVVLNPRVGTSVRSGLDWIAPEPAPKAQVFVEPHPVVPQLIPFRQVPK